jgi:uncharacterized protein YqkB
MDIRAARKYKSLEEIVINEIKAKKKELKELEEKKKCCKKEKKLVTIIEKKPKEKIVTKPNFTPIYIKNPGKIFISYCSKSYSSIN